MNKNRLFVLLKILIVAVLLGVIFFAIDWRDHYDCSDDRCHDDLCSDDN